MDNFEIVIIAIMIIGLLIALVIQFRLHKYVSKERLYEVEDVTQLWKNSLPPKIVLNDKGRKLHRIMMIGLATFVGGFAFMVLKEFV